MFRMLLTIVLLFALPKKTADAYTHSTTTNGTLIRWNFGQKFFLAGNPQGRSAISGDYFFQSIVRGLQQWKWATSGQMDFEYWQGSDPGRYPSQLSQNGVSSVFFASNSRSQVDSNIIGYTQVWFNEGNGELIEADVLLNDRNFDFTNVPSDTSANGTSGGVRTKVFLGNVVTHELGHAIGLSHSSSMNASMLYVEYREQAKIGCDDWAGARHLYPARNATLGSVSGTVVSPVGVGIAGAIVTAISTDRGIPLATAHTNQGGQFYLGGLEPGQVTIMVQPFQGSNAAIPSQMATREGDQVCSGRRFPTRFLTEADGNTLAQISVTPGATAGAGTIRIECRSVSPSQYSNQIETPTSFVDSAAPGTVRNYLFQSQGRFQLTAVSHLLLSSIRASMRVTDIMGNPITTTTQSPMYESASRFKVLDSQVSGNYIGPIQVQVTTQATEWSSFPSPSVNPTTDPYFVLNFDTGPSGSNRSPASLDLPENARCSAPESIYQDYQSPPGDPVKNFSESNRQAVGFCGTVSDKMPGPPTFGELLGWFLPLLAAYATTLGFKSNGFRKWTK